MSRRGGTHGAAPDERLVLGPRAVTEALRAGRPLHVVYAVDDGDGGPVLALARDRRVPFEARTRAELDALTAGVRHQGVVAIGGEYAYEPFEGWITTLPDDFLVVALDELTDPHNFGAIVRSAVAFGADGIVTLAHRAAPVTPVVVRASAGATEAAHITRVPNLVRAMAALRELGATVVGLDASATASLDTLGPSGRGLVLVVGSEGRGLRRLVRERCDTLVRIDMDGPIASLNASVAAGIAIHEAARLRRATR